MFDIVIVSTEQRPRLLMQSIESLRQSPQSIENSYTLVIDQRHEFYDVTSYNVDRVIVNLDRVGASRSRNIGASSIPKYRRHKYVMFIDDDVYMCPGWDTKLGKVLSESSCIASGHAHPYNHTITGKHEGVLFTTVLSTVHMAMPWYVWDIVGFFIEPGGPGGSEDVDYSTRAIKRGYYLALTNPECALHCGLTSSKGEPIVGAELVREKNRTLEKQYNIEGRIVYQ